MKTHRYETTVTWTGNRSEGTTSFRGYGRSHEVSAPGKPTIAGSSDPSFRGEPERWNPEELLVAALSQCHMLWYLHVCATSGVVVTAYQDRATGTMAEDADGAGRFTEAVLHPKVTIQAREMVEKALAIHDEAHAKCFIANSVNFPVRHEPTVEVA